MTTKKDAKKQIMCVTETCFNDPPFDSMGRCAGCMTAFHNGYVAGMKKAESLIMKVA